MGKKILSLLLIFPLLLLSISLVNAQDNSKDVKVGLYILNLGKFDTSTGAFTADFYLSMRCEDRCSPENFEFMNGRATSIDKIIDEPNEKFYRIQATLNSRVDLVKFPFDRQKMQIIIEDKKNTIDKLRYVPDKEQSGIDDAVLFTGWYIDGWDVTVDDHEYEIYDEIYSRYTFNINISKIFLNSFIKTLLPIIFIMLVALSSFVIDPDKIATRVAMISSALVASVMFHVSITNQIPPVGYLTFADKFMMLTYAILLVSFVINIIIFDFQERKKEKIVEKIHKTTEYSMLIIVPLIYIIFFLVLYYL
ncbi:MAG: hypothetical protein KatS3mg002_0699 [Candidatus Woesearchaeota archaeon]|nr:MAG: hypothetical protein KatS3mg002_0699 [Candidatus Woesearchaeota archaeon]